MKVDYDANIYIYIMFLTGSIYVFKLDVAITDTAQLQVTGDDFRR